MSKPVIGFIGLGLMGGNMVENLQKRGFEVVVMDINKDAVRTVLARGNATEAATPKELAAKSDIVELCVTTSDVVEKLVYGENGILEGIREGSVLIDFGTSIPASTRKIGADLARKRGLTADALSDASGADDCRRSRWCAPHLSFNDPPTISGMIPGPAQRIRTATLSPIKPAEKPPFRTPNGFAQTGSTARHEWPNDSRAAGSKSVRSQ